MPELEFPKANPENLLELIKDCYEEKLVILQFQRSFVWTKDQVEELLRSILRGYFIGTFLILDTSSEEPVFPYHLIEGVDKVNKRADGKT